MYRAAFACRFASGLISVVFYRQMTMRDVNHSSQVLCDNEKFCQIMLSLMFCDLKIPVSTLSIPYLNKI